MVRVCLERNQSLFVQIIDDPLNILAISTEVASMPCDWLRPIRPGNGAEYLPAGARQSEVGNQLVSRSEHSAGEPKQVENEIGQGGSGRRPFCLGHMSP